MQQRHSMHAACIMSGAEEFSPRVAQGSDERMKAALKLAAFILIGIPIGAYALAWALVGLQWWFEFPWALNWNWHW